MYRASVDFCINTRVTNARLCSTCVYIYIDKCLFFFFFGFRNYPVVQFDSICKNESDYAKLNEKTGAFVTEETRVIENGR